MSDEACGLPEDQTIPPAAACYDFVVDACLGDDERIAIENCRPLWLAFEQEISGRVASYGTEKFLAHYLAVVAPYRGAAIAWAHVASELETCDRMGTRPMRSSVVPLLKTFHSWVSATKFTWTLATTALENHSAAPCPEPKMSNQLLTLVKSAIEQSRVNDDYPELPLNVLAPMPTALDDLFLPVAWPTLPQANPLDHETQAPPTPSGADAGNSPSGPRDEERLRTWAVEPVPDDPTVRWTRLREQLRNFLPTADAAMDLLTFAVRKGLTAAGNVHQRVRTACESNDRIAFTAEDRTDLQSNFHEIAVAAIDLSQDAITQISDLKEQERDGTSPRIPQRWRQTSHVLELLRDCCKEVHALCDWADAGPTLSTLSKFHLEAQLHEIKKLKKDSRQLASRRPTNAQRLRNANPETRVTFVMSPRTYMELGRFTIEDAAGWVLQEGTVKVTRPASGLRRRAGRLPFLSKRVRWTAGSIEMQRCPGTHVTVFGAELKRIAAEAGLADLPVIVNNAPFAG